MGTATIPLDIPPHTAPIWNESFGSMLIRMVWYRLTGRCSPRLLVAERLARRCLALGSAAYDAPATVNLALNGIATQSSTAHDAPASRAIDGDTNGDFREFP